MVRRIAPIVLALAAVALCGVAQACPTCGDSIDADPSQQGLAQGIYYSILFMLATPFTILASLGTYFWWLVQLERKRVAAEAPARKGRKPSTGVPVGAQIASTRNPVGAR